MRNRKEELKRILWDKRLNCLEIHHEIIAGY